MTRYIVTYVSALSEHKIEIEAESDTAAQDEAARMAEDGFDPISIEHVQTKGGAA